MGAQEAQEGPRVPMDLWPKSMAAAVAATGAVAAALAGAVAVTPAALLFY